MKARKGKNRSAKPSNKQIVYVIPRKEKNVLYIRENGGKP